MGANIVFYTVVALVWVSSVNAIRVSPGKKVTEGNCSGPLDFFLCKCANFNTTINIQLLSGRYHFMHQPFCALQNKTSISLIGNSVSDTVIECHDQEPFNILFIGVQSVIIANITMVSCGKVANVFINQTVYEATHKGAHLGSGFRFAIMFYQVKEIIITNFTMQNTLGYGIVTFSSIGKTIISNLKIENTTFKNDPKCNDYDYDDDAADSICSGSGIFLIYGDNRNSNPVNEINATLVIDRSSFITNRNFLPYKQFNILNDAINTGFYRTSIPLQGAGGIAIFYLQNSYYVRTTITNSFFHNNNGTLSASIAIGSLSTIKGITLIQNCLFDDNNRIDKSSDIASVSTKGGISYYYLTLINAPKGTFVHTDANLTTDVIEIVAVVQCNFIKVGGTLGAAFHIEKISTDLQSLSLRIEECNFLENEANVGSAVHAVDHRFDTTISNGLIINLINVNAESNTLLPGATVEYVSGDFITGVFHSDTCHFIFDCNVLCNFSNNQPSVFYGRSAYITISGKAIFTNNMARFGGGLHLINTIAFVHQGSELYFGKNHATTNGGAIDIYFSNTNIQSQDTCPIQFTGSSDPIFDLKEIDQINVNITFQENTAVSLSRLESVFATVFYVCTWYPNTLTQINLGISAPVINGMRQSVYREIFKFIPANTVNEHLSILAYLPCPCNENVFDAEYCLTADLNDTLELGTTVIVGRSFTISLITLDVVGSVGHSTFLSSKVFSLNTTDTILQLPREQRSRSFSISNRSCTPIDFTIYSLQSIIPETGILQLSIIQNSDHNLHFSFDDCPIGFTIQNVDGLYACTCGEFFMKSPVKEDFQCNSESGQIVRTDVRSWLSVVDERLEYTKLCLPEYCNNIVRNFSLTDFDILCNHNRSGRACGACDDGLGKIFGSNFCRKCSNIWLLTILLYGIIGIILVLIIHLLKLTVTMGTINGLIFFCNIMSINESLFFDQSKFSFVRLFISLINLDLGFEICFYREMSQIAKTGLQFVFPLYLWFLMFIIIMVGKHYIRSRKSTHSAVPVLATLIFLSYAKLLRTTISVFTSVTVYYSTKESNFSGSQQFVAWQSDSNIKYLEGMHIILFLVALVFTVSFILPLAFALTFPKIALRSKKLSYFYPFLDCIYAPYKNKYRYWFGVRIMVLIYFSGMESILFSYQDSLLLSGVIVIILFTVIQAYIHPFKNSVNNTLDLAFMEIFITLAVVILYLYPDTLGHEGNIAVNILGSIAFILFCLILIFHFHNTIMHLTWHSKLAEALKTKFNLSVIEKSWNPLYPVAENEASQRSENNNIGINDSHNYAYLQESLLEEHYN